MKTRILAAAALLPCLLAIVLFLPTVVTAILFGVMAAIAAWELTWSTGFVKHPRLIAYSCVCAFLVALWSNLSGAYVWMLVGVLAMIVLMFTEVMISDMKLPFDKVVVCLAAGLLIPFLFTSIVRLHASFNGRFYIMIPFVIAFISDSGAYFAGRFLGKHKLAPTISPKKTVEGAVGGLLGAVLGMVIYGLVLQFAFDFSVNYFACVVYGLLGAVAGIFGDLCFSCIKRQTGIKDYSNLIPGHGGILDRFDSNIIIAPLVEILMIWWPVAVRLW